jgi:hypothetical protein
MAKTKYTQNRRLLFLTDAFVTLGILALVLEMAMLLTNGATIQASVYGPLHKSGIENRFERQIDTTSITSPTPKTFTACERRANRVRNISRRNQILTICHARQQGN